MRWEDVFWIGFSGVAMYFSHESGRKIAHKEVADAQKDNEVETLRQELGELKLKFENKED